MGLVLEGANEAMKELKIEIDDEQHAIARLDSKVEEFSADSKFSRKDE